MIIQQRLVHINTLIRRAEQQFARQPNAVTLLAVSKNQSAEKIREAFNAGQKCFGENYAQETLKKQALLSDLSIEWHFIGTIQSNKAKLIATHFDWVQSVNQFSIAEKLNHYRATFKTPLNICIEVNIDSSPTKSGVLVNDVLSLAKKIILLKNLRLRGLMIIPEKDNALNAFSQTQKLQERLIQLGIMLDTLSMGMSDDFEVAIESGSTMVRIGTAIFGERF